MNVVVNEPVRIVAALKTTLLTAGSAVVVKGLTSERNVPILSRADGQNSCWLTPG